ncbi:hypothetical protein ACTA71_005082 [Dictyostelium dimigraforme]
MMLDDYLQKEFNDQDDYVSNNNYNKNDSKEKDKKRKSFLSNLPLIKNNQQQQQQQQQQENSNQIKQSPSFEVEDFRNEISNQSTLNIVHSTSPNSSVSFLKDKNFRQKWVLTGNDSVQDEKIRHSHFFIRSPSISLAKSLFDLCESKKKVYNTCIELYSNLSMLLSNPKSGGPTLVAVCDTYLGKVELFQSLVVSKCSGSMSLVDLGDPHKRQLRDRLIQENRLRLAIDIATKCNIPADSAWLWCKLYTKFNTTSGGANYLLLTYFNSSLVLASSSLTLLFPIMVQICQLRQ